MHENRVYFARNDIFACTMTAEAIYSKIRLLPEAKLDTLMLFVEFLLEKEQSAPAAATSPENETPFWALAGSLDTPESGDELVKLIMDARTTKTIDTSWAE